MNGPKELLATLVGIVAVVKVLEVGIPALVGRATRRSEKPKHRSQAQINAEAKRVHRELMQERREKTR